MRYLWLCLLLLPLTVRAQTPIPPSRPALLQTTARTTATDGNREEKNAAATTALSSTKPDQKKVFDKKFYTLMVGLQASTVLDVESSYYVLNNCPAGYTCREGNPFLRPFVHAGRPAAYAFTTTTNALAVLSSYKLRKKGSRFWWVPMTAYIGIHTYCGINNLRTARR
ncbi:MAG: hypothetical protein U0Y68_03755 [Blastocatellia bacterium]